MALLYRAVWQDDSADLCALAESAFKTWVQEKSQNVPTGSTAPAYDWTPIQNDVYDAASGYLVEQRTEEEWRTTLRAMMDANSGEQWICVDVERTAANPYEIPPIAAPRLVVALLEASIADGLNPRLGPVSLTGQYAIGISSKERIRSEIGPLVLDPKRQTPLVFFSHDPLDHPGVTAKRAHATAKRLAGVAAVYLLTDDSRDAFNETLGLDLGVWGGAARIYLPGTLDPWRHRYIRREQIKHSYMAAAFKFSNMLRAFSPTARLPIPWTGVLEVEEQATQSLQQQIAELQKERLKVEERLYDALVDAADAQEDAERLRLQIKRERALPHDYEDSDEDPDWAWPTKITSFSELVEAARGHLHLLSIPSQAIAEIDILDKSSEEADVWAQTSWVGLRALHSYAERPPSFAGGFWEWSEHGDTLYRWPASPKKLAMSEAEGTQNDERYALKRYFAVDESVDPSGTILMEAHLKIAEGGGSNIPRIYFYDDTRGDTGKVHIGFIGPHRLVPNPSRS